MSSADEVSSSNIIQVSDLPMLLPVLLFDSLHFIFARMLVPYVSPEVAAPFVILVATVQIGIYGLVTKRLSLDALRKHFWFFITIGALIGVSTYLTYLAVAYIDAGTASMLSKVSTAFGVGLGIIWLREKFTPIQLAGTAVAILGTFVIAYQSDAQLRWGALIILIGSFTYSCHFAVVKRYGSEMDFVNFLFYRMFFTALVLVIGSAGRGVLALPTPAGWLAILIVGTFDVTLSRAFYYTALRKLDMSLLSVITTVGPVVTIGWALLFFGTLPSVQQLAGGVLVLIGVLVVTLKKRI